MRNFKKDAFEKKPISERENSLWEASEKYIHGNMNVESFEAEERVHEENFKMANLAFGNFRKENKLFSFLLIFFAISLIVFGFTIYIITRNQFSLIFPAVSVVVIRLISDMHTPKKVDLR